MDNPYKDEFDKLKAKDTFRGQQWFGERSRLVDEFAWAVPNEEVIEYMSDFDRIMEIGAGSGYWAKLLRDAGVSVDALDKNPPEETWSDVTQRDVSDILHRLRNRSVLMVWPPHDSRMSEVVSAQNPRDILYVGEPKGGCTGHDGMFFDIEERYALVESIEIPSYEGIHDNFYHYALCDSV